MDAVETPHLVKVSVFLPETVHLDLKRQAVDQRTSLQKIIADKVTSDIAPTAPAETLDSVGASSQGRMDSRTIKKWQSRLKRILESDMNEQRNRLAVLNCTASIEAMEALIGR